MGWSIKLFDVAGTAVRIHLTFFLLLAWIAAIHWTRGGAAEAIDGVLFIDRLTSLDTLRRVEDLVGDTQEEAVAAAEHSVAR